MIFFYFFRGGGRFGGGCQDGCERKSEAFAKIQTIIIFCFGGVGWGVGLGGSGWM